MCCRLDIKERSVLRHCVVEIQWIVRGYSGVVWCCLDIKVLPHAYEGVAVWILRCLGIWILRCCVSSYGY